MTQWVWGGWDKEAAEIPLDIYCEGTNRLCESFEEKKIILLRAKLWDLHKIQDIAQERKSIEEMTLIFIYHMW